jgi:hypothetical protein
MHPWIDRLQGRRRKRQIMVDFKLNADYVVTDADRNEEKGAARRNINLTQFLLLEAIGAKYPPPAPSKDSPLVKRWGEIVEKTDRRTVGRITNAVERAIKAAGEKDEATITLSQEQFEYLDKLIENWAAPSAWAGWWETLYSHIQDVKLAQAAAEKGAPRA